MRDGALTHRRVPFVFMTGYGLATALIVTGHRLTLKPGDLARYEYLLKPVAVKELLDAVRRLLPRGDAEVVPFPKPE